MTGVLLTYSLYMSLDQSSSRSELYIHWKKQVKTVWRNGGVANPDLQLWLSIITSILLRAALAEFSSELAAVHGMETFTQDLDQRLVERNTAGHSLHPFTLARVAFCHGFFWVIFFECTCAHLRIFRGIKCTVCKILVACIKRTLLRRRLLLVIFFTV